MFPSDIYIPSLVLDNGNITFKGIFQDIPLFQCWKGASPILLWSLWEIMITETPLLIIADTPSEVSYTLCNQ